MNPKIYKWLLICSTLILYITTTDRATKAERKTKHSQVECYDALQIPAGMRSTKIMKIFWLSQQNHDLF